MEQNNLVILSLAGAGLLAAIALGVVLKSSAAPETTEPVKTEVAAASAAAAPAAAPPAAPTAKGARTVPTAPEKVDAAQYTTTESGLQYFDVTVGTGKSPGTGSMVLVEYAGFLEDGTLFDSSYKRPDSFKFPLAQGAVIKGWDEGVASMKVGGKRQLRVPSDLAYGDRGAGSRIPGGATLIFDVELINISPAPPPRVAPAAPTKLEDTQYTVTESGLKYHDFSVGEGALAAAGDTVQVDYTGWTLDGNKFDSSLDRQAPIAFPLGGGRVIKGWDEGIAGMEIGGKRQLYIPFDLAYGEAGRPPTIPAKATLIFEVELVSIRGK